MLIYSILTWPEHPASSIQTSEYIYIISFILYKRQYLQ